MLLTIVLAVLGGWMVVAVLLALLIGRAVRIADRRSPRRTAAPAVPAPAVPARVHLPAKAVARV